MQHWEKPFYTLCHARDEYSELLWERADRQAQRMLEGTHLGNEIRLVLRRTPSGRVSWNCSFIPRATVSEPWLEVI